MMTIADVTMDRAIHFDSTGGAELITLGGQYPGCIDGTRVVTGPIRHLPALRLTDIAEILDHRTTAVAIWGGGITWIITADEETTLLARAAERKDARDRRQAEEDAAEAADREHERLHPVTRPCPLCGTYCYGDCTAH